MSKVISAREVEAAAAAGQRELNVPVGTIVTPSARDRAREMGIAVLAGGLNGHSSNGNGNSNGMNGSSGRWVQPQTQAAPSSAAPDLMPAPNVTMPAAQRHAAPSPTMPPGGVPQPGWAMAQKPNYFGSPSIDNLYTISMELGAAIWVVKDRLRVVEELLERAGIVTEQMVEQYAPDPAKRKEIISARNSFIEKVYGIIKDNPG